MIEHGDKIKDSNQVVFALTAAGVKLENLLICFDLSIAPGSPQDIHLVSEIVKALPNAEQMKLYSQYLNQNGKSESVQKVLLELAKAGAKGTDLTFYFKILNLHGVNPQD